MIKYFEVGQKVYCMVNGEGIVTHTEHNSSFPLQVKFRNNVIAYYKLDGRFNNNSKPILSQKPIPEIINEPLYELSFKEAIDALLNGKKVRREDWKGNFYLRLSNTGKVYVYGNDDIVPYPIDKEDMLKKWCIVD